jgi:hypothetical protein
LNNEVETKNERLCRVGISVVNFRLDADLEFLGTERTGVKVLVESVNTQIVLLAMLIELSNKHLLRYEQIRTVPKLL